jgi:hypothetical protein
MRAAMERRDARAVADAFAVDAEFHSPLTDKLTFKGREQIVTLAGIVLDVFENFRYTAELMGDEGGSWWAGRRSTAWRLNSSTICALAVMDALRRSPSSSGHCLLPQRRCDRSARGSVAERAMRAAR